MNDSTPVVRPLKDILGEINLYIAGIVAYVAGVSGAIPVETFQKTTSLVTVIVTLVSLWLWRWSKITSLIRKFPVSEQIRVGRVKEKAPLSFVNRCIDPLLLNGKLSYVMNLPQRRAEIFLLAGFTIFSLFQVIRWIPEIGTELGFGKCGAAVPSGLRVAVTKFDMPDDDKFDTRLYSSMSDALKGKASVCWVGQIVQTDDNAIEIGKRLKAAIVIWGNRDDALFQVNIVSTNWDALGNKLDAPSDEIMDFRYYGLDQVPFFTEYVLSKILYVKGNGLEARNRLAEALEYAKDEEWFGKAGSDLADVYFQLGALYHDDARQLPESEKAIDSYAEAIRLNPKLDQAYLNRAGILLEMGRYPEAISDSTFLIENGSFLSSFAYLIRAQAQSDSVDSEKDFESALKYPIPVVMVYQLRGQTRLNKWHDYSGAIDDFAAAIQNDPQNQLSYHGLGKAYLLNEDYKQALGTYETLCFSLDQNIDRQNKEAFIEDLENLKKNDDELFNLALVKILALIQSAPSE